MEALRVVINIIFILVCVALTVLVLMQEGKSAGLGSISGAAETYWGRNKGRSMEGMLVKITKILAVFFMLLAVVLNLNVKIILHQITDYFFSLLSDFVITHVTSLKQ